MRTLEVARVGIGRGEERLVDKVAVQSGRPFAGGDGFAVLPQQQVGLALDAKRPRLRGSNAKAFSPNDCASWGLPILFSKNARIWYTRLP